MHVYRMPSDRTVSTGTEVPRPHAFRSIVSAYDTGSRRVLLLWLGAALCWISPVCAQGTKPADAEALKALRARAEQGVAEAQLYLGVLYYNGDAGVAKDYREAARWYRKAADQNNAEAQFNLGLMYDLGQAVSQDYSEAARWYRKAADQGNADAETNLATKYGDGQGVPQSYAESARWFRKAAEQGDADAQYNLGFMYDHGQRLGFTQDYSEAANWYRKAADQGSALAQGALGALYVLGQGVAKDYVQAYVWMDLAIPRLSGDLQRTITQGRDAVAGRMTRAQIAEAQRLVREWKPKTQ
jgi:uncharacterized protein